MMVASAIIGVATVAAGQMYLANEKSTQERRNAFLKTEIAILDKQIAEIAQLKDKTQNLLARKDVVESLQSDRSTSVRVLDQLARRLPDGLYLKSLKQVGDTFQISGYAQSSARVSTFMRALDESPQFLNPTLVEVKAANVGNMRLNEFDLKVALERAAAKPGSAKAGQVKGGKI